MKIKKKKKLKHDASVTIILISIEAIDPVL